MHELSGLLPVTKQKYNKGNCIFDCLQILVLRIVTGINNGADN